MAITRSSKRNASPSRDDQPSERPPKRTRTNNATSDSQETNKSTRSARESTAKTKKGRHIKAKLDLIMTIPTDVFCEIAAYLSPEDLLAMARASKTLRNLLMSKSSRAIWTAAERAEDMPACPPDLSCPQYASLVFDKFCMACSTTRKIQGDIWMRYRLCAKCEKKELIEFDDDCDHEIGNLAIAIPCTTRVYESGEKKYYKPTFDAAKKHFLTLTDKQTKATFLVNKLLELDSLYEHAEEVEEWLDRRERMKEEAIQDMATRRFDAICHRLCELGCSKDDFPIYGDEEYGKWESMTTQPRELTDRIWKNIRPQLEDLIRRKRERENEKRRRACLEKREGQLRNLASEFISTPKGTDCFCSFEELLRLPTVVDYLQADGLDSTLSETNRQAIKNKMFELGALRKQEVVEKCESRLTEALSSRNLLPPDFQLPDNHKSILEYKYAFFMVSPRTEWGCRTFESVLRQFREDTSWSYKMGYRRSANYKQLLEDCVPNFRASAIAKELANAFGVGDLTMQELDALGVAFSCKLCNGPHMSQPLQFRWSALIEHFYKNSKSPSQTYFSSYSPDHSLEDKVPGDCVSCLPEVRAKFNSQS